MLVHLSCALMLVLTTVVSCSPTPVSERSAPTVTDGTSQATGCKLTGFEPGEIIQYCKGETFHLEVAIGEQSLVFDQLARGKYPGHYWKELFNAVTNEDVDGEPMVGEGTITWYLHHVNPRYVEEVPELFLLAQGAKTRYVGKANVSITGPHSVEVTVPVSGTRDGVASFVAPIAFFQDDPGDWPFVCVTSADMNFAHLPRLTDGPYQGRENILCGLPAQNSADAERGKTLFAEHLDRNVPATLFPLVRAY